MLRKIGQNYQIAIPREIIRILHLKVNEYVNIRIQDNQIILEPQMLVPKEQAYFFTPEWQKEEREASEDLQKGRVTKTKNLKDLFKKLDS